MNIRVATVLDRGDVQDVHLSAFPEGEKGIVSRLAVSLLSEETDPETISLVAETGGTVVGHAAFSPVTLDSRKNFQGYILAPLAVKPEYQKRGTGSQLVQKGMHRLSDMGVDIVFVYGDPKYYGRFGFSVDAAERYTPPYRLQYPFGWQGISLKDCCTEKSPVKIACVASLCDPVLW